MAGKTVLNNKIYTIIREYIRNLKKEKIPIEKVILFGSYAKGNAKEWSDIDLAIVSIKFGRKPFDEMVQLMKIKDNRSLDIEPHPFHPKDLKEKWDILAHEIRTTGITIDI